LARLIDGGPGLEILGGYAAFVTPESPLTHIVGAGVNGPVAPADLDAVERFYAARDAEPVFELSPLADEAFLALLQERGYRITQFENTLVVNLLAPPPPPAAATRLIEPVEDRDWAQLAARGFFSRDEITAEEAAIGGPFARHTRAYVAEVEGQPVATASLWLHDEIAFFLTDSTLPAYRGRGLQPALIQQRLIDAIAAGARYATAGTTINSPSQTNYLRHGFRVLYTKLTLRRP